jgi:anti-sigma B factor antagonist
VDKICNGPDLGQQQGVTKIYQNLMVPKPCEYRLFHKMTTMNMNCETLVPPAVAAAFAIEKESKLKLSLETRNRGEVIVVYCQGRIVYRDEAAALSRLVGDILQNGSRLVLELSGVTSMDSAGIGELALIQTWAVERKAELKCSGANTIVRGLLDLTNLDSVLEVYATLDDALESFVAKECVDC